MTSSSPNPPALTFRCPAELCGWLPEPIPATQGLPQWLRSMPQQAYSAILGADDDTVKRCPPFLDAMTTGFLIPLMCDVRVVRGEFSWDAEFPTPSSLAYPRSPIGFHDPGQVSGTPLAEDDRYLIKFHSLWTIAAPEGYSLLFTHPANRHDLPFTTLTGMVDADRYNDIWVHFPARWRDETFEGVLPRGTPVAQCIPVKRERWRMQVEAFDDQHTRRAHAVMGDIAREKGVYRRDYRA